MKHKKLQSRPLHPEGKNFATSGFPAEGIWFLYRQYLIAGENKETPSHSFDCYGHAAQAL